MDTLDSELLEPDEIPAQERVPLSGEALDAAVMAMESPDFLPKLTGRIMQQAKKMGFHSPFQDSMDLPGGKSAADLAGDVIEKALVGNYSWDPRADPGLQQLLLFAGSEHPLELAEADQALHDDVPTCRRRTFIPGKPSITISPKPLLKIFMGFFARKTRVRWGPVSGGFWLQPAGRERGTADRAGGLR